MDNNQLQPQPKHSGSTFFQVVVILLLTAIFGLTAYIAHWVYANSASGTAKKTVSNTPSPTKNFCDKTDNEHGCSLNSFQVSAPKGGEQVCLGSIFNVKWTAPSDMETVTITLRQGSSSSGETELGVFPASKGTYAWTVTGATPGEAYKMWINSTYKGHSLNNSSGNLFTIKDCR